MERDARPNDLPSPRLVEDVWRDNSDYLVRLAAHMLGDRAGAEDVVQEAFGRLASVDLGEIRDERGWLAVVVRRLCLDRMRSDRTRVAVAQAVGVETSRRELEPGMSDPFDKISLDTEVQLALAIVLDKLSPAERTIFVLHDVFGFPFATIGEMVGRTPAACRQLATRARRSIRTDNPHVPRDIEITEQRVVVERFIAACAGGDIDELIAVLDPAVVGEGRTARGEPLRLEGAQSVARRLILWLGPATERVLVPVPVEDQPGIAAFHDGKVDVVLTLQLVDGRVHHIGGAIRRPE